MALFLNKANDNEWVLQGPLNVRTIRRIWREGYDLLEKTQAKQITLNLQDLTQSDSASVALLIDWQRYAKQHGKTLRLHHVPEKMREIIRLSNLQNILEHE
ncbi:MAG: STAS domain-containing protein [Gammaproteobacteria bacterium]|jgi:phospholipid transport system transporter-binding protein